MNTIRLNIPKALLLAFALAVGILVLLQVQRSAPAVAAQAEAPSAARTESSSTNVGVLVTVFLRSNSFTTDLPEEATQLLTTTKGSTAARLAARRNPLRRSDSESAAASIAENARNAALPLIRAAAAPDVRQNNAVQRTIRRLGGRVISASPIPNQVVTSIPRAALSTLRADHRVHNIAITKLPILMAAPIDGSATWWTNGFTGQGTSADGNGSPDAVVFDTGLRTTHDAFKTRLAGDLPNQDGSGPSRVISPVNRADILGSKHGNTIGAQIAATDLGHTGGGGMAYGIDKLYDNYEAANPYLWDLGINSGADTGLAGNTDLPEVINYSAGLYQDAVDLDPAWNYFDALESRFGILNTISAGNCGINTIAYNGCDDGPHRVSTPGVNYNVMTMGGLDITSDPSNFATYAPWPNTSPGPTWGGRKKPDLIGPVLGTAGTPSAIDDHAWTAFGYGTSFAAPVAAGGALLLASAGVYLPTAQKAIMVNSATPVQSQTYWTPRTGWGAINMSNAYYARGNYANGSVSGGGANSARFYQVNGVANGDRATLVWNRRTTTDSTLSPTYYALTDLDLTQIDPNTLAGTSSGGSDAADTVDTDQTVTAANPMPGNSSDGGDNIEQIRSTGTGTQILKVKAMSAINGASVEPYSLAADHAPTALSTPIPQVTLDVSPSSTNGNGDVQVTARVENPSDDLALDNVSVTIAPPPGTSLPTQNLTFNLGNIVANGTASYIWTVRNNNSTSGTKSVSVSADGTSLGEPFTGSGSSTFDVDATPPTITVAKPPAYSKTATPVFQWIGSDPQSAVTYDVESSIDNSAFTPVLTATPQTSGSLPPAAEGQNIRIRVRSTDSVGNVAPWSEVSTTIDVVPPVASLGKPDKSKRGTVRVPVYFSNVGSPVTATFSFANNVGGRLGAATNGQVVTYVNSGSKLAFATLRLIAKDALGREASATETYPVETARTSSGLKFSSVKKSGSGIAVAGKVSKSYSGKVTVTATRIGSKGTKKVTRRVTAKNGTFKIRLGVRPGTYKVVASTAKTSRFSATSTSKKLSVK